jgi:hypothetical protein
MKFYSRSSKVEIKDPTNPEIEKIVNRNTPRIGNLPAFQKTVMVTSQMTHADDIRTHGTPVMWHKTEVSSPYFMRHSNAVI